jgi:hypothetical protein
MQIFCHAIKFLVANNVCDCLKNCKNTANIRNSKIVIARRDGKAHSDAYLKRGPTLTKLGQELHIITGAHVKIHVLPTWSKGKQHLYKSAGFPDFPSEGF